MVVIQIDTLDDVDFPLTGLRDYHRRVYFHLLTFTFQLSFGGGIHHTFIL
ncbi:MAG: hypothetical protein IJB31_00325 [Akkermansia sp.]|nr:hypothetical protein [Akkermansia sp.]